MKIKQISLIELGFQRLIGRRNRWLFLVFVAYLFTIVIFSVIYFIAYKFDTQNFYFDTNISEFQKDIIKSTTEEEVLDIQTQLTAFNYLSTHLFTSPHLVDINYELDEYDNVAKATFKTLEYLYIFQYRYSEHADINWEENPPPRIPYVTIYDKEENNIGVLDIPFTLFIEPLTSEINYYNDAVLRMKDKQQDLLDEKTSRLSTLLSPAAEIWSYPDFLYFSTVTQTGVGYGDILPNSTLIRMLVTLQILIGLAIVVVIINLFVQGRHREA